MFHFNFYIPWINHLNLFGSYWMKHAWVYIRYILVSYFVPYASLGCVRCLYIFWKLQKYRLAFTVFCCELLTSFPCQSSFWWVQFNFRIHCCFSATDCLCQSNNLIHLISSNQAATKFHAGNACPINYWAIQMTCIWYHDMLGLPVKLLSTIFHYTVLDIDMWYRNSLFFRNSDISLKFAQLVFLPIRCLI
jgi:hypothetical protein